MRSGALVSLAATLGSQREISRLRLCFEHVTFESTPAPYSPGDNPWEIIPASPEAELRIAEALADYRSVPSRYEGQLGAYHAALTTGGPLPVTLADAHSSLELVTALYHWGRHTICSKLHVRPTEHVLDSPRAGVNTNVVARWLIIHSDEPPLCPLPPE
jgi:hypothetical protein